MTLVRERLYGLAGCLGEVHQRAYSGSKKPHLRGVELDDQNLVVRLVNFYRPVNLAWIELKKRRRRRRKRRRKVKRRGV